MILSCLILLLGLNPFSLVGDDLMMLLVKHLLWLNPFSLGGDDLEPVALGC